MLRKVGIAVGATVIGLGAWHDPTTGAWLRTAPHHMFGVVVPVIMLTAGWTIFFVVGKRAEMDTRSTLSWARVSMLVITLLLAAGMLGTALYWLSPAPAVATDGDRDTASTSVTSLGVALASPHGVLYSSELPNNVIVNEAGGRRSAVIDGGGPLWSLYGVAEWDPSGVMTLCTYEQPIGALRGLGANSLVRRIREMKPGVTVDVDAAVGRCVDGKPVLYVPYSDVQGWWHPTSVYRGYATITSDGSIAYFDVDDGDRSGGLVMQPDMDHLSIVPVVAASTQSRDGGAWFPAPGGEAPKGG